MREQLANWVGENPHLSMIGFVAIVGILFWVAIAFADANNTIDNSPDDDWN